MEYLASHGYIVIAPDFLDTKPPDYQEQIAFSRIKDGNVGQPLKILRMVSQFVKDMSNNRAFFFAYLAEHRLNHTSFTIDVMLALNRNTNSTFYQSINEEAIGICGHSLGGTTALGKIGAYPDKQFKDSRIKAALIFSAPAYPFESTASNIDVPIMIMAGDDDEPALHPGLPRRTIYDEASVPKYYLVLEKATHLSFGNTSCGQSALYQAVNNNPQVNAICRYGLAFFEKYLLRNHYAGRCLEGTDSAWAYYIKEEKAGQSFEWGTEPPPGKGGPGGIGKEIWDDGGEW
jgi:predicted dienelactone hydrolase